MRRRIHACHEEEDTCIVVAETHAEVVLEHIEGEDCRVASNKVGEFFAPATCVWCVCVYVCMCVCVYMNNLKIHICTYGEFFAPATFFEFLVELLERDA